MNRAEGTPAIVVLVAGLVIFGGIVGILAYKQVPEGHQGVTKEWGAVNGEVVDAGAHFKIPIMQGIQNVETRPRTYTMSNSKSEGEKDGPDAITVKTINGSSVDVDITVRYRIKKEQADVFVARWNHEDQMEERLIRPTLRSVLRDEASSLQTTGPGSIYTQQGRQALEETAIEALNEEFANQPIELEAVQIRRIDLPQKIDNALDRKEQAKQQVQVEQEKVEQEKQRKQQKIIQAEADAEAQLIDAEADAEAMRTRGKAAEEYPVVVKLQYIDAIKDTDKVILGGSTGGAGILVPADSDSQNESEADSGNAIVVGNP